MTIVGEAVAARIRDLPDRAGIYVFRSAEGTPLYVGKAKSLRKRAANYLGGDHDARILAMLGEAADLEFVVAESEAEALLLENAWIKRAKPRYNVLLRDDKTYPYLKLTNEPWPRLAFTRRIRDDGAKYFGPYLPGGLARRAIKLVQKLFGVRVCRLEIDGRLPRPCLYHDMHRCLGPCVAALTTPEAYASAVEEAALFLGGRTDLLLRRLRGEMEAAAGRLEFESAARLRDLVREVEGQRQRRSVSSVEEEDADIFGVVAHGHQAAISILVMRGGQVLDRRELFWEGEAAAARERVLSELLPQIYERTAFVPKEVLLPFEVEGDAALADWLSEKKGERVYLRFPVRGPKAERVRLAERNAEFAFRRRFRLAPEALAGAAALASHLDLDEPPRRIEGFDISNLQGAEVVASVVVWEEGRMRRDEYRSFNVRNLAGQDDFAAIEQAITRRYRRVLDEGGVQPDLILIDGGRGQLNAALAGLAAAGADELAVFSLAKREEEIYLPALPEPLRLDRRDPALQLAQSIRDEAHRFAVTRHRRRRSARLLASRLDEIPGVGPRRRKRLLERFGSVAGVAAAPLAELEQAVGSAVARRIAEALQREHGIDSGPAER